MARCIYWNHLGNSLYIVTCAFFGIDVMTKVFLSDLIARNDAHHAEVYYGDDGAATVFLHYVGGYCEEVEIALGCQLIVDNK